MSKAVKLARAVGTGGVLEDGEIQAAQVTGLATVATSGSYTDLTNKPSIPSVTGLASETYVTTQINNLIGGAPGTLDTLKEISDQLATDQSAVSALTAVVNSKASTESLAVVATSGSYTDLLDKPTIPSANYEDLVGKPTLPLGDLVGTTDIQTLTNKTLTDPKLLLNNTNGTIGQAVISNGDTAAPSWGDVVTPTGTQTLANKTIAFSSNTLTGVQPTLVSGTSIKTVNNTTLLGSGDLAVQSTLVSGTNIKTINGDSVLGSGDLTIGGFSTAKAYFFTSF